MRRVVSKTDVAGVTGQETAYNPNLNPLLAGFIPFDSNDAAEEFLNVPERTVALQRYIANVIKWEQATFARNMVRLILTYQYRYDHAFPAGKFYKVRKRKH